MAFAGAEVKSADVAKGTFVSVGNGVNTPTFTNTDPVAVTPVVSIVFVAPPSGRVLVTGGFHIRNRTGQVGGVNQGVFGAVMVRKGTSISTGEVIYNPVSEPNRKVGLQGVIGQVEAGLAFPLGNLVAGDQYTAYAVGWVTDAAVSGDIYSRGLDIIDL